MTMLAAMKAAMAAVAGRFAVRAVTTGDDRVVDDDGNYFGDFTS